MSFNNIKGNSTVMTDEDNVLVNPTDEEIINANPAFKSLKDKTQNITATENDTTFAGNIVVGDAINAGDNNITALKGWYIQYMDISGINSDTLVFYIGINQLTFEEGKVATEPSIDSTIESGYAVGDTISFVDDFHALNCAVIKSIDHNKITVGSLGEMIKRKLTQASANNGWVDNGGNAQNDYSLCVFAKPTINEGVIINDNGYAFGRNNLPIGGESMAHGSTNISMGEYSTTQGVGLTSEGYAQTVVGAFNTIEPDTDNQYGSKNVFVVGNGGNLSNKSTAFTVKWSGDATIKNNFQAGGEVSSASMTTNTLSLNGQDVGDKLTSLQNNVDTLNNKTQKITSDGTSTTISGNLDISNGNIVADSVISAGEVSGSDGVFSGDVSVGGTSVKEAFENIRQEKESRGTLYFSGGSASATPNLAFDTLSVLFKTDFDFSVPQTTDVFFPFVAGQLSTGTYLAAKFGSDDRLRVNDGATTIGSFMRSDIAALAGDGNAFAFVFKKLADANAQVSLFVNGVSVQNRTTATAAYPTLDNALSVNKWDTSSISAGMVGYSDFRILNFDVSAEDAPYSLNDYQNGKPIPPYLLNNSGERFNIVNAVENTDWVIDAIDCLASFTNKNGVYTIEKHDKIPDGNYQVYFFIKLSSVIKAGSLVKLNLKRSGGTAAYKLIFTKEFKAKTAQASFRLLDIDWNGDVLKNNTLVLPVDCNGACIQLTPTFDVFSFKELSIEVNGAIVALENYTIARNVTTKLIKDISGNGNDATVSGNVAGDKDAAIAAFVDELKTQINQQG